MSKELVIGSNRHETRVAILEDDQLVEVYFQRANEYSLAGSIHKGRVTRVLPGMQSAFVDLGLERDTFLYVSDFFEEHEDIDTVSDEKPVRIERRDRGAGRNERSAGRRAPSLSEEIRVSDEGGTETAQLGDADGAATLAELPGEGEGEEESLLEATSGTSPEEKPGERGEPENRFRGDRRSRRSRRRKQRGRGFPDNKYAQPTGISNTAEPEERAHDEVRNGPEQAAEVLILPGESLAKYRSSGPSSEAAPRQDPTSAQPELPEAPSHSWNTPSPEPIAAERSAGPQDTEEEEPPPAVIEDESEREAIEAEAEELDLANKVFAHHDEQGPHSEADDTAKVSNAEAGIDHNTGSNPRESGTVPVDAQPLNAGSESTETPRTTDIGAPFLGGEEFLEEIETVQVRPAGEEDGLEEFDPIADTLAESKQASEESLPQTASVREQGERALHRVSRRSRRRRGGNRHGIGNSEATGGPALTTGNGHGAAASVETEPVQNATFEDRRGEKEERTLPSISDLLKVGQEIIVQIAKEPLGQKGARITSHIALPGRYVVFMPSVSHLGVSRKIASDEERQRLKRVLQAHRVGTTGGFIVRTAGEGVPEEEIAADMNFLYNLWLDIRQKAEKKPAPVLLHCDLDIVQRILRDQVTEEFKAIWVDNEEMYESALTFMQRFQPALVNRVKMYTRSAPIFDAFNITQELEKALRPKVWLKSGGYIVINQTEALVAIDINTGKYVGKSNRLEDTIVKTNTEAVKEIVRQIRLRDLGGIIVVDFIDMDERKNRQKVMQTLEEAMRADKAPYKILQFNDFGLVAITRKRVKQSLERALCSPCPYCEGAGYVKSIQTIVSEILIEAQKIAKAIDSKDVMLRAHPEVAKVLKASNNRYLEEIEEILGRPVLVKGDPTLHTEKFDLA